MMMMLSLFVVTAIAFRVSIDQIQYDAANALFTKLGCSPCTMIGTSSSSPSPWCDDSADDILCENGNIIKIYLDTVYTGNRVLNGSIATQLGLLTNLETLKIIPSRSNAGGFVVGSIPTQLGFLRRLTDLEIRQTNITGTIPSQLGSLTGLTTLCALAALQNTDSISLRSRLETNHLSGMLASNLISIRATDCVFQSDRSETNCLDCSSRPRACTCLTRTAASCPTTTTTIATTTTETTMATTTTMAPTPTSTTSTTPSTIATTTPTSNAMDSSTSMSFVSPTMPTMSSTATFAPMSTSAASNVPPSTASSSSQSMGASDDVVEESGNGALIGGIVGGVAGVLLLCAVVAAVVAWKKRRNNSHPSTASDKSDSNPASSNVYGSLELSRTPSEFESVRVDCDQYSDLPLRAPVYNDVPKNNRGAVVSYNPPPTVAAQMAFGN